MFFQERVPLILMTERFHFFHRYRLRGVRHLIWYGPPTVPRFYPEILNFLEDAVSSARPVSSLLLFNRFDSAQLEGILGTARGQKLLQQEKNARGTPGPTKNTFVFY